MKRRFSLSSVTIFGQDVGDARFHQTPFQSGKAGTICRLADENAGLQASVAPFAGAELAGLQVRFRGEWIECLDRGENHAPCERWQRRGPWLWPAVRRSYTPDQLAEARKTGSPPGECRWFCSGRTYPMPIHGFVRDREWNVGASRADRDGAEVQCTLTDDAQTRRYFPFGFLLSVTFRLAADGLQAVFRNRVGERKPRSDAVLRGKPHLPEDAPDR